LNHKNINVEHYPPVDLFLKKNMIESGEYLYYI